MLKEQVYFFHITIVDEDKNGTLLAINDQSAFQSSTWTLFE